MFSYFLLSYIINCTTERLKKIKRKILEPASLDAIKAMRRGGREAEMERRGPGMQSRAGRQESDKG